VLSVEYSDTSDAARVVQYDGGTTTVREDASDQMLQEIAEAMGDEAPQWVKDRMDAVDEDAADSGQKLVGLARRERFVVAAFGLDAESGQNVEVDFAGFPAEAFDGVAFVTNSKDSAHPRARRGGKRGTAKAR
jgi:hypothetical protein